jgi:DNA-binding transcriptional LysR family regulator
MGGDVRFKGLDLNLLVGLDALLSTHSVSRSADIMALSQPAMSAALARLREYFKDDILVAHGKRMYPTAFAESLHPQVQECLRGLETLIATSMTFDPATSLRQFEIVASDYATAAIVAPLVIRLAEIAPQVRINITQPSAQAIRQLELGKLDLCITPEEYLSAELPSELLYEEEHVLVGWNQNPLFQGPISEDDVFAAGHVCVAFDERIMTFADRQLDKMGKARRVEVVAASFIVVPWLLRNTSRVALMHRRLAVAIQDYLPITCVPLPFAFPVLRQMIQYHQARATDEGLVWLRRQLHEIARETAIAPGPTRTDPSVA